MARIILGTSALTDQFDIKGEERLLDILQGRDELARMLNGQSVPSSTFCAPGEESFHVVAPVRRIAGQNIDLMGVYKVDAAMRDRLVQRGLLATDHESYELFGNARAAAAAHNSGDACRQLKACLQESDKTPVLATVDISAQAVTPLRNRTLSQEFC